MRGSTGEQARLSCIVWCFWIYRWSFRASALREYDEEVFQEVITYGDDGHDHGPVCEVQSASTLAPLGDASRAGGRITRPAQIGRFKWAS